MQLRLAAVAACLMAGASAACAQTTGPGEPNAFPVLETERAADIWSPEAMAAASDVELPNINPADIPPSGGERAGAAAFEESDPAEQSAEAGAGDERGSGNVNRAPLHWSGRLFFTKTNGARYRCSAQFISPTVLVTAAHCVRDNASGLYYGNVVFALGYRNGSYRQLYRPTCVWTYNGWVQEGFARYRYDYAFIKIGERSRTGHWGASWNWDGRYNSATKTGYPAGILNGEVIQVDRGPIVLQSGIVEMRHGNPADQHGSSGGAWIGKYSSTIAKNNYVISVESFGYDSKPGHSYGPYMDDVARRLRKLADGPCN